MSEEVSEDSFLQTMREIADTWAEQIRYMQPLTAQRWLASNVDRFHAILEQPPIGPELAGRILASVERAVWERYDRTHKRASA